MFRRIVRLLGPLGGGCGGLVGREEVDCSRAFARLVEITLR